MRILVVENEKDLSQPLKVGLEAEFFAVDIIKNNDTGSYLARTNDYDLLVLDIDNVLPRKIGTEICRELRVLGKNMPIIVLSVKSDTTTKVELLNAGADDYLTKPFSFEELLARVRALMRRPQQLENEIYEIDDLKLDTKRHAVKRGSKEIYLARKEFMLLEYLLRNKGIALSRGMILEHVWDMDTDPFSNTIESHVLTLRRKIDFPGKRKLIHTVPGRGYKLGVKNF